MKPLVGALIATSVALPCACAGDPSGDSDASSTTDAVTTSTTDTPTSVPPVSDRDTTTGGSGQADESTTGADSTGSSTGAPVELDVELQFEARVGDEVAACGQSYEDVGTGGTTIEFLDLRLFVSNVRLVDEAGAEVPVAMADDGEWQLGGSALLDFEDASGSCSENTTPVTNTTIRGVVPEATYTGIRFDVGLPFEHNHLNADEAAPPLNTTAMFWNWAAGYKFAKIDVQNDNDAPNNRWNFHLGSQACDNGMAGPTIPPGEECGRPGRPAIAIDGFDPLTGVVVLDIAAMLANEDVSADTPETAPGCQSFMADVNECDELFPTLGMSWMTGDCDAECSGQTAFRGE